MTSTLAMLFPNVNRPVCCGRRWHARVRYCVVVQEINFGEPTHWEGKYEKDKYEKGVSTMDILWLTSNWVYAGDIVGKG